MMNGWSRIWWSQELHFHGTDILRQGSLNSEDGGRVRYIGDYDEIDAAEVLSNN